MKKILVAVTAFLTLGLTLAAQASSELIDRESLKSCTTDRGQLEWRKANNGDLAIKLVNLNSARCNTLRFFDASSGNTIKRYDIQGTSYTLSRSQRNALASDCRLGVELDGRHYNEKFYLNLDWWQCSGGGGDITPDPDPEPVQACQVSVKASKNDPSRVHVYAGCQYEDTLEILVTSGGQILADKQVYVTRSQLSKQQVATFRRNPVDNVPVRVRFTSLQYEKRFNSHTTVVPKVATFNHPVRATINTPKKVRVAGKKKALGRGTYYKTAIEVSVWDKDIVAKYPQSAIRIELIKTTNDQHEVISSRRVSTAKKVSFNVRGDYIKPLVFGKAHWDKKGHLFQGENTFKLRIYDAYQTSKYVEIDGITLTVNN